MQVARSAENIRAVENFMQFGIGKQIAPFKDGFLLQAPAFGLDRPARGCRVHHRDLVIIEEIDAL